MIVGIPLPRRAPGYGFMAQSHSKPSAENEQREYVKFPNFMKRLVAVPHSEIREQLDAEKQAQQRKRSSASRAARRQGLERRLLSRFPCGHLLFPHCSSRRAASADSTFLFKSAASTLAAPSPVSAFTLLLSRPKPKEFRP